jgi:hypothetical protein
MVAAGSGDQPLQGRFVLRYNLREFTDENVLIGDVFTLFLAACPVAPKSLAAPWWDRV